MIYFEHFLEDSVSHKLVERMRLWWTVINESNVDKNIKKEAFIVLEKYGGRFVVADKKLIEETAYILKGVIFDFLDDLLRTLGDFKAPKNNEERERKALFDNIRTDAWAFFSEECALSGVKIL